MKNLGGGTSGDRVDPDLLYHEDDEVLHLVCARFILESDTVHVWFPYGGTSDFRMSNRILCQ